MKKSVKIPLIVLGSLAFLVILISLLIAPVAKWYVQKHSKELVGRVVTMEKLRINIFSGSLRIVGFDLKEPDEHNSFVTFDTLAVKVKLLDFLRHKVTVQKIHLTDLHVSAWQNNEVFSFDDIIRKFSTPDSLKAAPVAEDTTATPWAIGIYDIQLRRGNVHFSDLAIGGQWNIEDLSLAIPGVYFSGASTDIGFDLLFRDGGKLAANLKYDIEKSIFNLHLDLEKFTLAGLLPYLQQSLRLGEFSGILDTHLDVDGDLNHIMNSVVKGTVALTGLNMLDEQKGLVLAANNIFVDVASISLAENKFEINEFSTEGLATRYVMNKDSSSNFTRLIKPSKAPSKNAAKDTTAKTDTAVPKPMQLLITQLALKETHISYTDHTLQVPFHYELKDLSLTSHNFDPNNHNKVDIHARLGATGKTAILWDGNFNNLSNLKLKVDLRNVALKDFTPYSLEYTAYPVSHGFLHFTSHNVVKNNMLKGANDLNISKCTVDKARKDIKPMMKVPLRLGLYILKDRNDEIKIELPIEGDIKSPGFSYKKIILNTLTNLLVKVAMSPFDFVSGAFGSDADKLNEIMLTNTQSELTQVQYDKLSKLSGIILSKPDLMLSFEQYINYGQASKDLSMLNLKRDYYLSLRPGEKAESLDRKDEETIAAIEDNDEALLVYANLRIADTTNTADVYTKASLLYKAQIATQIATLAGKRNQLVRDYLGSLQVPAERLHIETVAPAADSAYNGPTFYKTNLVLPDEMPMGMANE